MNLPLLRRICTQAISDADDEEAANAEPFENCPRSGTPTPSFITSETVLALLEEIDRLQGELQIQRKPPAGPKLPKAIDTEALTRKLKKMHRRAQHAEQLLADRGSKRSATLERQLAQEHERLECVRAHNASLIRMLHRHGVGGARPVQKEGT